MTTSSPPPDRVELAAVTDPAGITPALRQQLIDCWIAVSNAGGAAGFPFPPVDTDEVAPVADQLLASLHPDRLRLLLALDRHDQRLLGWVVLAHTPSRLIGHWATVHHLQTHPAHRGQGIGSALMRRLQAIARDDMGLEQLHLAVRGAWALKPSTPASAGVRSAAGPAPCACRRPTTATRCCWPSSRSDPITGRRGRRVGPESGRVRI